MYSKGRKIVGFLMGALIFAGAQRSGAQNNMQIYLKYCTIRPHDACFSEPVEGAVDTVGRNVFDLGGTYRFCLDIDSINSGFAPVRVILVLDNSGSMCFQYGPDRCCVPGDGSGMCSRNDSTNQRVVAAKLFVDSLRAISPLSEVGVMVFVDRVSSTLQPLSLDNDNNYSRIQSAIDGAGCSGMMGGGIGGGLAKTTAVQTTNCGVALQQALVEVDRNFNAMSEEMKEGRHIVLLTDGAWDDNATRSPQTLYEAYSTSFPDRTLPTVHGIFLSDSATHVAHGYPPEGCAENDIVDMSYLQYAALATGGIFEPGSHPETVVEEFRQLLNEMIRLSPQTLSQMSVTNTTNGASSGQQSIERIESDVPTQAHYHATINNLPLEYGLNTLLVQRVVQKPGTQLTDTTVSTVYIYRTEEWTSEIIQSEYEEYCVVDSTYINISVTPQMLPVNSPFTVNSTIHLKEKLILDSIQVRVFTQFPDADPSTVAVFHLERNVMSTSGTEGAPSSSIAYTETDGLFGKSVMSQGSFSTSINNIPGDFTLEAWIKPSNAGGKTDIFSVGGVTFGIGADRLLYFTANNADIAKSTIAVDANTWSHVAVSRVNGYVILFINGVDVSTPVEFSGALMGALTVACPDQGLLDEVRISNSHRLRADPNFYRLDIPSLQKPVWTVGGTTVTQPYLVVSPDMWTEGTIQFEFASPLPGKLVVNFQHRGTMLTQWSKNGNVVWAAGDLQGPYITKATFINGLMGEIYDTLFVEFSEPVKCDSLKKNPLPIASFQVYGPDTVTNTYVLKPKIFEGAFYADAEACPSNYITKATIVTKASIDGIVPKRDSIVLVGLAVDTAGNYPDTTRKRLVEWGPGRGIVIMPYQNEELAPMELPEGIRLRTGVQQREGKAIIIQTRGPLVPVVVDNKISYGRTVIFDAVANVVAVNLPILPFPNNNRMYYVIWDGTNRQKRRVSSGAYLLRAAVQYENEDPTQQPPPLMAKFSIKWSSGQ
ncbi:MAG: hypothetical protein JXA18_08410 [Chitinispirillaceae bacterium]|nr:hypothetical protein [Chitinispirillaceae bacterium]